MAKTKEKKEQTLLENIQIQRNSTFNLRTDLRLISVELEASTVWDLLVFYVVPTYSYLSNKRVGMTNIFINMVWKTTGRVDFFFIYYVKNSGQDDFFLKNKQGYPPFIREVRVWPCNVLLLLQICNYCYRNPFHQIEISRITKNLWFDGYCSPVTFREKFCEKSQWKISTVDFESK